MVLRHDSGSIAAVVAIALLHPQSLWSASCRAVQRRSNSNVAFSYHVSVVCLLSAASSSTQQWRRSDGSTGGSFSHEPNSFRRSEAKQRAGESRQKSMHRLQRTRGNRTTQRKVDGPPAHGITLFISITTCLPIFIFFAVFLLLQFWLEF
jgi:hypothetical protein